MAVHPSYLLRLPDAGAKAREYERFVDDLKIATALLRNQRMRLKRRAPDAAQHTQVRASRGPSAGSVMRH